MHDPPLPPAAIGTLASPQRSMARVDASVPAKDRCVHSLRWFVSLRCAILGSPIGDSLHLADGREWRLPLSANKVPPLASQARMAEAIGPANISHNLVNE